MGFLSLITEALYACCPFLYDSYPVSQIANIALYRSLHGKHGKQKQMSMLTGSRSVVSKTEVCMCDLSHLGIVHLFV